MQSQQSTQSRCLRTFSDGRGCRMLRKPGHPALCVFQAREEEQLLETAKLAAELASLSGSLNTGLDINRVLGKVFQALAQRRISPREATAFAYIAQLMLQSMPYVKNEIRWATNDAEAYYRMIRQSIPAVRNLPKSQSTLRRRSQLTALHPLVPPPQPYSNPPLACPRQFRHLPRNRQLSNRFHPRRPCVHPATECPQSGSCLRPDSRAHALATRTADVLRRYRQISGLVTVRKAALSRF
jgi:hypothetical protein